jgi:hypothetical protein
MLVDLPEQGDAGIFVRPPPGANHGSLGHPAKVLLGLSGSVTPPGPGHRAEDTMSHDKIRAATRQRMAETGEPYATARRAVIRDYQLDTLLGSGPGSSGVAVDSGELRVRMGDFKLSVPRSSVRYAGRSRASTHGSTGVHGGRGRWLVNGSASGLVELTIEPPCYIGRGLSTMFRRERVRSLTLSMVDPDGFIAAVEGAGHGS